MLDCQYDVFWNTLFYAWMLVVLGSFVASWVSRYLRGLITVGQPLMGRSTVPGFLHLWIMAPTVVLWSTKALEMALIDMSWYFIIVHADLFEWFLHSTGLSVLSCERRLCNKQDKVHSPITLKDQPIVVQQQKTMNRGLNKLFQKGFSLFYDVGKCRLCFLIG